MPLDQNTPHLLVVDDDTRIRSLLQKYLLESGYFVSTAKDTEEADDLLKNFICDLIILDLMLPKENGISFIKRLKKAHNKTPVIMLTAMGETENRIEGLEVGADDYLAKPFEPKELLLRIANILKHNNKNKIISFGSFTYNQQTKCLYKYDNIISITQSENDLLFLLIQNANTIVEREELANKLSINERSVDVQIVRLRNKIEENPSRPTFLQTIRGQGYIFRV